MAIKARDAIAAARALIGTPYGELDCINLIKAVIRTAPGGVPGYTTAGTNALWRSYEASGKYRDLTWRQEGWATGTSSVSPSASHLPQRGRLLPPRAGMLAFKRFGDDVRHVGLVTGEGTVIHASSARGQTVETALDGSWQLLAIHRYIDIAGDTAEEGEGTDMTAYPMRVKLGDPESTLNVRNEPGLGGDRIGKLADGTTVTVQAEMENGWRYIAYGDSGNGYVDGRYLEPYAEPEPEAPIITIVDSAGNRFEPVGDFRVLVGSID